MQKQDKVSVDWRSRLWVFGAMVAMFTALGAGSGDATAQTRDSWFGRPAPRVAAPPDPDVTEAREQAEAARLFGDAQKSMERGHLQDARNRLELLVARYPDSHLIEVARRELHRLYDKLAAQVAPPPSLQTPGAVTQSSVPTQRQPMPEASATSGAIYRPASAPLMPSGAPAPMTGKAFDHLVDEFRNTAGDRIFFTEGSSDFGTRARVGLEAQASWLKRNPSVHVTVVGHADDVGGSDVNRDLSRRRAEAVMARLVELGVEPARIDVLAAGRDRPVSTCGGPQCANQNRLVMTTISRVTRASER